MTFREAFVDQVIKEGFAIAPECLSKSEIDVLASELNKSTLQRSRAGIRHLMHHPAVEKLARSSPMLDMARSVLGPSAFPYRATLFDKSPDSNWLVVWHQDTALPLQRRHDRPGWGPWSIKDNILYAHATAEALSQVLALRLHLDSSNIDNGPLRVLPATHKDEIFSDSAIEKLATTINSLDCTVARGGVLAMRPLLVHASSKSHSQQPRRVLHIEYATRPVLVGIPLAIA